MKKFYTLIAALCSFVAVEAQTFEFVNKAGETIANGSTVTFNTPNDIYMSIMSTIKIEDEGLAVKNVSGATASCKVKYEISEITENTDFQICMASGCVSSAANGNSGVSNEAKNIPAGDKTDVLAHWAEVSANSMNGKGHCNVKLTIVNSSNNAEESSINVVFTYGESANLKQVNGNNEIVAIYTLSGQRSSTLNKGANIVRYKNGRTVKVIMK